MGKLQIKDGTPQVLAEEVTEMEVKEQENVAVDREFMGLIIPDGEEKKLDDILDVCDSYPGNISVIVAMNGKKYDAKISVRKVEGLLAELKRLLPNENVIFFRKKC